VRADYALLAVAVLATSTSAPLVRQAAAPALAVAFWRNAMAAGVLVPAAASPFGTTRADHRTRGQGTRLALAAGVLLAAHFATWISSLSYTTVASSVALVSAMPVWSAMLARWRGEVVPGQVWVGITVALAGVVVLTGVDFGVSARALGGDALAVVGGVLAAGYVTVGAAARRHLSTTTYAARCYSVAAGVLLVASLIGRQHLGGYHARTWLCLIGITLGPQLLGHTLINRVLARISATVVSMALLGEVFGAPLIAAWWFGETPSAGVVPAAVLIVAGVVMVVRARAPELEAAP